MFRILVARPAKDAIQLIHDWWAEHHSADEAARWYLGIYETIKSLEQMPERCYLAPESNLRETELRQLHFGIGKRPSHRIVFAIEGRDVVILAVRHVAQEALSHDDLQ